MPSRRDRRYRYITRFQKCVRLRDGWHTGTARLLPDDNASRRLKELGQLPALAIRAVGTDLLTVCVHLDP